MKISTAAANLFLVLGILFFTFAGLEIFFRATHLFGARISWSVPDPLLGWRFMQNGEFQNFKENDHPVSWSTNAYGWKDKTWALEKPEGMTRVAVLGDSFVEGMQVETHRHFLTLAENALNQNSSAKFEFMNFGRSGFTQSEELLVLQNDILRFNPDALMLFFFAPNDIEDIRRETAPDVVRPFYTESGKELKLDTSFTESKAFKLKSLIAPLKHRSVFVSFFSERLTLYRDLQNIKKLRPSAIEQKKKVLPYLTLGSPSPDPEFTKNYALNKRLIEEISKICKARGIRLILVNIATPAYLPDKEAAYKLLEPGFDPVFFDNDLKALADSLGAKFIGLQRIFTENYSRDRKDLNWKLGGAEEDRNNAMEIGHWNYEGHELLAKTLRNTFEKELTSASQAYQ